MTEKNQLVVVVRTGFTAQQFVLLIVTFLLGLASAAAFEEIFVEKSFGPASVVAAQQDTQKSN